MRYERKLIIEHKNINRILAEIKRHPFFFSSPYPPRWIHSIYLDTPNYDFYHQNIDGEAKREKYRIRWYTHNNSHTCPKLEIKKKTGLIGTKDTYTLQDFNINKSVKSFNEWWKAQRDHLKIKQLAVLSPASIVTYYRHYFLSQNKQIRITIDSNLSYNQTLDKIKKNTSSDIVLEIKYDPKHEDMVSILTQSLKCRLSKYSKYIESIHHKGTSVNFKKILSFLFTNNNQLCISNPSLLDGPQFYMFQENHYEKIVTSF